ncbi:hypothetical protein GYMLUDRAFT_252940 [Collybiopsis luxurians FD-317 M1]|uniref:Uncharacterized protein n=1 Tax=Collybiopsis luxurians FD-317 M1 TaxID=944289 RepID=A0A0D0AJX8_9AGAR|nr:hypothetical protein GYMLUDRAFT_252940 [Collybiopsis luxurians FD-317 M1]
MKEDNMKKLARFAFTGSNPQVETAQKKVQEILLSTQQTASKAFDSTRKMAGLLGETAVKYMVANAAGFLGQRAGSLLGSYQQPVLYNLTASREIVKHVYRAEGLSSSSVETVRSTIRIYSLEAYGIFKIGEIVRRRSIVGYKLDYVATWLEAIHLRYRTIIVPFCAYNVSVDSPPSYIWLPVATLVLLISWLSFPQPFDATYIAALFATFRNLVTVR